MKILLINYLATKYVAYEEASIGSCLKSIQIIIPRGGLGSQKWGKGNYFSKERFFFKSKIKIVRKKSSKLS